ncbi:MAG TPA: hypothetical protein VFX35_13000 [Solirubrobacterales bacterium]|nr:hypothetical protein [Solirubrobacterales bacterium]
MGTMKKPKIRHRLALPLLALALSALLPTGAAAYPSKGGGLVGDSTITISLDGKLRQALDKAGVQVLPLKPAGFKGKALRFPLKEEGGFEPRFGTGYAFLGGGIRFRSGSRSVAVRRLVLDTAKKRLAAVVSGHTITLAAVDDVKAHRTDLGIVVKVETLRWTTKGAQLVGGEIGRRDLFKPHKLLGRAVVAGEFFTVSVTGGTIDFSFDEGFRHKLESLGVSISTTGAATQTGSAPLAYQLPEVKGDVNRTLTHGGIRTAKDGFTFTQPSSLEPRVTTWTEIGLGFENGFGGEGSDVATIAWQFPGGQRGNGPIGQIEFGESPTFDPETGTFSAGPVAATVSPYAVQSLNGAFAEGKPVFSAGEPLGSFSFVAGVR